MTEPLWFQNRCLKCAWWDRGKSPTLKGKRRCRLNYPPQLPEEHCSYRVWGPSSRRKRLWRDGYIRDLRYSYPDNEEGVDWLMLERTPRLPAAERKKTLAKLASAHMKKAEEKGSSARIGFGSDFSDELVTTQRLLLNIPSIDAFLGGGFPLGPMTIGGEKSVGKTTICLCLAAAAQKAGYTVGWVDAEHSLDKNWAITQGVDFDTLVLDQSMVLQDQLNWARDVINQGLVDILFIDSINASPVREKFRNKSGKERDLDDHDVATPARLWSDFYPQVLHSLKTYGISLVTVAQIRVTGIGTNYIRNAIAGGGNARKFYDLLTLLVRRGSKSNAPTDDDGNILGYPLHIHCEKSKVSGVREGEEMQTVFWNGVGFDPDYELVLAGLEKGILVKMGNAQHIFTDSKDQTHKLAAGKEWKVTRVMVDKGLISDLRMQITGEVPEEEPATT